jgi:hypothetical protein
LVLFYDVKTYTTDRSIEVWPAYWAYHFGMYEFKFLIFEMEERTEYQGMEESITKN